MHGSPQSTAGTASIGSSQVERSWNHPTWLLIIPLLSGVYFLAGKLGLSMAFFNVSASPVWPPTGIAIAALLVFGYRAWPGVFLGAFFVNLTTAGTVATSLGVAAGNTLEALSAAFLVGRYAHGRRAFERAPDIFRFALLAGLLSTMVSATIGVTSLALGGFVAWPDYGAVWLTWGIGNLVGALVVCPLLVLWANDWRIHWRPRAFVELAALLATLVATSAVMFELVSPFAIETPPLPFVLAPLVVWAAFRFGPRGAASVILILAAFAVRGTIDGLGPFVRGSPNESLLTLQAFMGILSLMALPLAAMVQERTRVQEALRRSHLELEQRVARRTADLQKRETQLVEAQRIAHVGGWEWDVVAGQVTWTDEMYRLYGLPPNSIPGSFAEFIARVHPDDRERVDWTVRRSLSSHEPFAFDHRVVWPDGTIHWLHGRGQVVLDDKGQPVRLFGTGQDITERIRAENERRLRESKEQELEQLKAMDKFKTELLNTASHELNTPLTPLKLQLHLLRSELGPLNPRQHRAIDLLDRNVDRVILLVHNMLDVARIQGGRLKLAKAPHDLHGILHEAQEMFEEPARQSGLRLAAHIEEKLWVDGDAARLTQVLFNLLSNAVKFTPGGGGITIEASQQGEDVNVRIHDTGIGLTPQQVGELFRPFVQVHSADQAVGRPGTGLGLYISKEIIAQHGGRLWVESHGANRGSTFIFSLPRTHPKESPAARGATTVPVHA